jgi:hypothetical protein
LLNHLIIRGSVAFQLTSRLAAARAECQERAAANWLTFIHNQFTAAPAQIKVNYPILGPGCGKPMLSEMV